MGGKSPVLAWAVGLRNCVCTAAPGDQAIRAFHGPLVDLPRGPPHVGLSWWRDPGFHQVSHFLFFFYNIDTYTLYDIPIYNTMLTGTARYALVAPPLQCTTPLHGYVIVCYIASAFIHGRKQSKTSNILIPKE